jgi:hypothetical protein
VEVKVLVVSQLIKRMLLLFVVQKLPLDYTTCDKLNYFSDVKFNNQTCC